MICAIRERGVKVRILTPGAHADHLMTRRAGRRRYGDLLQAGAEIYEYQPEHDPREDRWSSTASGASSGSTNFDNRSFGLNDEVNVATPDRGLARRLEEDFENDLAKSHRITYEEWSAGRWTSAIVEWASRMLERQS